MEPYLKMNEEEFKKYIDKSWNKHDYYLLVNKDTIVESSYCCSSICEVWWNCYLEATHVIAILF